MKSDHYSAAASFVILVLLSTPADAVVNINICRATKQAGAYAGMSKDTYNVVREICGTSSATCGNSNNLANVLLCSMLGPPCGVTTTGTSALTAMFIKMVPETMSSVPALGAVFQHASVCTIVEQSCCFAGSNQHHLDMANNMLSSITDHSTTIPGTIPIPSDNFKLFFNNFIGNFANAGVFSAIGKKKK